MTSGAQAMLVRTSEAVFWVSFLLVLYTYAGYPVLAAAMARFRPRRWRRGDEAVAVSILLPVHNGAAILQEKMEHLLRLNPTLVRQILVVSDGSTDETMAILDGFRDSRLQVLNLAQQAGKAEALNQAMLQARHDIIVFTDIRPSLDETALRMLVSNFSDPTVGCAAGELVVRQGDAHDAAASTVGGAYWRYEQWIRTSESTWDSPVGVYGGFYAVRRSLARPFPPGLILDDMFQPLSVVRQGYRNVLDRSAVAVDTWPATTRGEFQRKVRTLAGNFQLMKLVPWLLTGENRLRFQLISHKLLRLVVPYAFVMMLCAAVALAFGSRFWLGTALAQGVFWSLAALSLAVRIPVLGRVLGGAGALLTLNAAAVAGLYTFLFTAGPLWRIWKPTPAPPAKTAMLQEQKVS